MYRRRPCHRLVPILFALLVCSTAHADLLMWQIADEDSRVYLLGSIHFLPKDYGPLPAPVMEAFAQSERVVFETDLDVVGHPAFALQLLEFSTYPEGRSLEQSLSPELFRRTRQHLVSLGIPAALSERLRPWFVTLLLSTAAAVNQGLDPGQGVDAQLFAAAKEAKKSIQFLESAVFQIRLLADLNEAQQIALLEQTLDEIDNLTEVIALMIVAWEQGDKEALDTLLNQMKREETALYERLVLTRNRNWLSPVRKLLALESDVLMVVGAGHLVGEGSLINLLEEAGLGPVREGDK